MYFVAEYRISYYSPIFILQFRKATSKFPHFWTLAKFHPIIFLKPDFNSLHLALFWEFKKNDTWESYRLFMLVVIVMFNISKFVM